VVHVVLTEVWIKVMFLEKQQAKRLKHRLRATASVFMSGQSWLVSSYLSSCMNSGSCKTRQHCLFSST